MYDPAQEIEMIVDRDSTELQCPCDFDAGTNCRLWPQAKREALGLLQREREIEFAPRKILQTVDRCDGSHGHFTLRRILIFELPSPGGYPRPLGRPEDGGSLESNLVPVASSGSAGSFKVEEET